MDTIHWHMNATQGDAYLHGFKISFLQALIHVHDKLQI